MKICNHCNRYYEDSDIYCLKCNRPLKKYDKKDDESENDLLKRSWSKKEGASITENTISKIKAQQKLDKQNLPKCPTCGTTNIRHISSTERGVNAVMFGFFGNKRKCQFECLNPNCRYRW